MAYSVLHFQKQAEGMPCNSYVWDVNNPNTPDFELRAGSQLCCCSYNQKDSNVLLGGMYNGQVAYWEDRYAKDPEPFEWYQRYDALRDLLRAVVPASASVLVESSDMIY